MDKTCIVNIYIKTTNKDISDHEFITSNGVFPSDKVEELLTKVLSIDEKAILKARGEIRGWQIIYGAYGCKDGFGWVEEEHDMGEHPEFWESPSRDDYDSEEDYQWALAGKSDEVRQDYLDMYSEELDEMVKWAERDLNTFIRDTKEQADGEDGEVISDVDGDKFKVYQ